MTARLIARLERLQPRQAGSYVITRELGDSDEDLAMKVRAAGRPVVVMPPTCRTTDEWLIACGPARGNA